MSNWRQFAERVKREEHTGDNRDERDDSPPIGPNVPNVPLDPSRATKAWRASLEALKLDAPLHGLEVPRWRGLLGDSHWLLDQFGLRAARDGFSTLDLFGVMPGRDGWGGIACRLRSSRSLVMSSDVARWRRVVNGEPESFARGLGETVEMIPLWEMPK